MRLLRIAFILLLTTMFSGVAGFTAATGQDMTGDAVVSAYRLGVDDRIELTVFGEDDMTRELRVGPAGTVEVPLIGIVKAAGRTVDDIRTEITTKLADGFLREPRVTLAIVAFRPFFILGEVNKPGQYPYQQGMTVQGAVATAEGFTYRAQKKWVIIKHENDDSEKRVEITPSLTIRPGDTIRVAERYF